MTTLQAGIDQLLAELREPILGLKIVATLTISGKTGTTIDARVGKLGTSAPSNRYEGWHVWSPTGADVDQFRTVASQSTDAAGITTFTFIGASFSATVTSVTVYLFHPDVPTADLLALMQHALTYDFFEATVPLTEGADGDFQASTVTDFTDSGATSSKVATAADTFPGLDRSLRVANAGAGDYTATASQRISRGKQLYRWAIVRADVGTARMRVVDTSGNLLGEVATTEEDWTFVYARFTPGSTIEEIVTRFGGDEASAVSIWATSGFIRPGNRNVVLPAGVSRRNRLKAISIAQFDMAGSEAGAYVAASRELFRLREGEHYRYSDNHLAANARYIELEADLSDYPVWLTYLRPYGEVNTISWTAGTGDTDCDLDRWTARNKHLLAKYYKRWKGYRNDALDEVEAIEAESVTVPPEEERMIGAWSLR